MWKDFDGIDAAIVSEPASLGLTVMALTAHKYRFSVRPRLAATFEGLANTGQTQGADKTYNQIPNLACLLELDHAPF